MKNTKKENNKISQNLCTSQYNLTFWHTYIHVPPLYIYTHSQYIYIHIHILLIYTYTPYVRTYIHTLLIYKHTHAIHTHIHINITYMYAIHTYIL
jgi:hypothetical protein